MTIDFERFTTIKKAIACAVDEPEEITEILVLLARTPNDEWLRVIENGKHHRKVTIKGVCALCTSEYETIRTTYADLCQQCYSLHWSEIQRLNMHYSRAKEASQLNRLRLVDWLVTLGYFNHRCAYCQSQPYEALDHFIPIALGGGTTKGNCIPACEACNRKKMRTHPDKVKGIPRADIERVREFLTSLEIAPKTT